jgi:hypothetical protein
MLLRPLLFPLAARVDIAFGMLVAQQAEYERLVVLQQRLIMTVVHLATAFAPTNVLDCMVIGRELEPGLVEILDDQQGLVLGERSENPRLFYRLAEEIGLSSPFRRADGFPIVTSSERNVAASGSRSTNAWVNGLSLPMLVFHVFVPDRV